MNTGGENESRPSGPAYRSGSTLVEIMIGCVLLAILALAAFEYYYQTAKVLSVQRKRTVAMAVINGRIEAIRATSYASLTNFVPPGGSVDIMSMLNGWQKGSSETVTNMPIRTTLRYVDSNANYSALLVGVRVEYATGNWISNNTIYAP